ncbi:MAG: MBL fold metallo-hydrolase [Halanaeroarchaeum sp.]
MTIRNLAADVQAFTSNVFLVTGQRTVVVDPGANFDVVGRLEDAIDDLDAVVLTHTHPDHVDNARAVTDAFGVETWGFDTGHPAVDNVIADGDSVTLGDDEYRALHTPGHKDDHLCFYAPDAGVLFAGDLVFGGGGFGRTDLEEGDRPTLVRSIERVLEEVRAGLEQLHSGHGPSVTEAALEDVEMALRMARSR